MKITIFFRQTIKRLVLQIVIASQFVLAQDRPSMPLEKLVNPGSGLDLVSWASYIYNYFPDQNQTENDIVFTDINLQILGTAL